MGTKVRARWLQTVDVVHTYTDSLYRSEIAIICITYMYSKYMYRLTTDQMPWLEMSRVAVWHDSTAKTFFYS